MTDLEHAAERIDKEESRGSLALWFGVLGSPMAWAAHLGVNYSLEEWFACSSSNPTQGKVLGLGVGTAATLFNTAMAVIALASLLVALSCWRKLRGAPGNGDDVENERTERARWMAFAGVVEGGLFLGIILFGYLPVLTIDACEITP